MSRQIRFCQTKFRDRIISIADFADGIEMLKNSQTHVSINRKYKDHLLGFCLMQYFVAWEDFLEDCFARYLCGYKGLSGRAISLVSTRESSLASAQAKILGGRNYVNWSVDNTINRSKAFFSPVNVINSTLSLQRNDIESINKVRNAVAHRSSYARAEFELIVFNELGYLPVGITPGKFLRMRHSTANITYVRYYGISLIAMANTIANN